VILQECGLDTLCFLRVLRMGYRISLLGMANAIWLFAVYATSPPSPETAYITDGAGKISIANVPSGSSRFVATVIAAYILFGYVMYLVYTEFTWFIEQRHRVLSQPNKARNYAVFCRIVPLQYRSNAALAAFFQQSLAPNAVLQAELRVTTPELSKLVKQRDVVIQKLERVMYIQQSTGESSFHVQPSEDRVSRMLGKGGTQVESIPTYTAELAALNKEIKERIEAIEDMHEETNKKMHRLLTQTNNNVEEATAAVVAEQEKQMLLATSASTEMPSYNKGKPTDKDATARDGDEEIALDGADDNRVKPTASTTSASDAPLKPSFSATDGDVQPEGTKDGEILSGGFVCFTNLNSVQISMQTLQYSSPFEMEVLEAPDPEDVLWANVGRSHKELQIGVLISVSATVALCLLWTIPITFASTLSSVDGLRKIGFINDLLNAAPILVPFFQIIAPFIVVIVNGALPAILTLLSGFEAPASRTTVAASTFGKLASFMIIQTFFVSIVSGSVLKQLENIVNNPTQIVSLLAVSLPGQSTYFIQIVFVSAVIPVGLEILRVIPIVLAFVRGYVGPRLNQKEREKKFIFLRPLADPSEFSHFSTLASVVLNFMVLLVYAVMSPITAFVLCFCFFYLGVAYRHQFVYIYPPTPDSGGKMWMRFINILLVCMLVAQITIIGLLALKKSIVGVLLMIPLIVVTALFNTYMHQQHFRTAEFLPAQIGTMADRKSGPDMDLSFLRDAFVQPELQVKEAFPEVYVEPASLKEKQEI